jgi:hypothetical protein
MKNPLVGRVLVGSGVFFFVVGLVLIALHLPWVFWAPAFVVGLLDLLAAALFFRS